MFPFCPRFLVEISENVSHFSLMCYGNTTHTSQHQSHDLRTKVTQNTLCIYIYIALHYQFSFPCALKCSSYTQDCKMIIPNTMRQKPHNYFLLTMFIPNMGKYLHREILVRLGDARPCQFHGSPQVVLLLVQGSHTCHLQWVNFTVLS